MMKHLLCSLSRLLRLAVAGFFHLVLLGAVSWAASAPVEETPEKTYVPVYIIIIMAVVLGLTAICRMGKRSFDVKRPTQ